MARKTWVSVLVAVGIIVVMFCIALVGAGAYFVRRHVHAQFVAASTAGEEFQQMRTRFEGQTPMIEIAADAVVDSSSDAQSTVHTRVHKEPAGPGGSINALHVLAYDGREGKLVRVDIPRWVLSFGSNRGRFRLSNIEDFDYDVGRITLEDLDRHGPGLVMDIKRSRGTQVLIWAD